MIENLKISNENIRLIALDLDGTTLQPDNSLANEDKTAIEYAIKKGIHVVIATGRVFSEIPNSVKNIDGLEFLLSANGAKITNNINNEIIHSECLNDEITLKIINQITDKSIFFELYNNNKSYSPDYCKNIIEKFKLPKKLLDFYISKINFCENIKDVIKKCPDSSEKFYIILKNEEIKQSVLKQIKNIENIEITESGFENIEINKKSVSKAKGLSVLCDYLNISLDNCVAIGDSLNDYEMLKSVGYPVAMDNSPEQIKRVCKLIVSDNLNNGVAQAIRKLL